MTEHEQEHSPMKPRLSGRQLAIMQVLWKQGEASVAAVQQSLDVDTTLAYSTVATVLARLEKRGLVTHRTEGRTFLYRAAISESNVGDSMIGELVERVFGGSPSALVSYLLETDRVDRDELARIKKLVFEHDQK